MVSGRLSIRRRGRNESLALGVVVCVCVCFFFSQAVLWAWFVVSLSYLRDTAVAFITQLNKQQTLVLTVLSGVVQLSSVCNKKYEPNGHSK